MKPLRIVLGAIALCFATLTSTSSLAQTLPTNIYLGGASFSDNSTPKFAASGIYAHQVATTGTYAFTLVDALKTGTNSFNTNIGVGVAQKIATIAGAPIFVPTAAGISLNSSNAGWAWSTGLAVPFKIKGSWLLMPALRAEKSSIGGGTGYQFIPSIFVGWAL